MQSSIIRARATPKEIKFFGNGTPARASILRDGKLWERWMAYYRAFPLGIFNAAQLPYLLKKNYLFKIKNLDIRNYLSLKYD